MSPLIPVPAEPASASQTLNQQYVVHQNGTRILVAGGDRSRGSSAIEQNWLAPRPQQEELGDPDFPDGIDYGWASAIATARPAEFADAADFIDIE